MPTAKIKRPIVHVHFPLFVWSPFVMAATMISIIEKAEVKAANKKAVKNPIKTASRMEAGQKLPAEPQIIKSAPDPAEGRMKRRPEKSPSRQAA